MKLQYVLRLADDAMINGHRLSEWCGHGPVLEQDIALTNTALDHLGRARSLYQYAAELFNQLPAEEQKTYFTSIALQTQMNSGAPVTEDSLAFLRDSWDFRNVLLVEQPNHDWAYTVLRSFFYDTFNFYYFAALLGSKDESIAAVAEKSLKEATYHLRWSSEWVIRLGDGTEESHQRLRQALNDLWMYSGELFETVAAETAMAELGIAPDMKLVHTQWLAKVKEVFAEANMTMPEGTWMQSGGKEGRHSEHLGYVLAEMQFMQRAYPGMEW